MSTYPIDLSILPYKIECRKCHKLLTHKSFTPHRLAHRNFICKKCYNKQARDKYKSTYSVEARNKSQTNEQTNIIPTQRCVICNSTYTSTTHPQICPDCIDNLTYGIMNEPKDYPEAYLIINTNLKDYIPTLQFVPIIPPHKLPPVKIINPTTGEPIKIHKGVYPPDDIIEQLLPKAYKKLNYIIIRKPYRLEIRMTI